MLSVRGPRRCAITFASTSRPSIAGLPTLTSLPSWTRRTRPSLTEEPGSAAMRSTRIRSPRATRYCFPPLTITADSEESGLGTARDCTKHRKAAFLVNDGAPPGHHRLDDPEGGEGRDRGRPSVGDQWQWNPRDRQHANVHAHVLDHLDEHHHEH